MDFTIKIYQKFLESFQAQDYYFQPFSEFFQNPSSKPIILRHDVDKLPENSLRFAQIQYKDGIKGSYYFRMVPQSYNEEVIKKIADFGHEIGYHYEDMDFALQRIKTQEPRAKIKDIKEEDLYDTAIEIFQENLEKLRKLYPVKTICMHGSPLSKFDNKSIWNKYDYKDYGIISEPYFDIDFNEIFYLTDTGRRWDGGKVSVRDKVKNQDKSGDEREDEGAKGRKGEGVKKWPSFHSTNDIIKAAGEGRLPDKIMMTFHPQRWNDKPVPWVKELVWQNVKNVGKRVLVRVRKGDGASG